MEFSGTAAGHAIALAIPVIPVETRAGGSGGLAALWARERVADILDRSQSSRRPADTKRLEKQAVALSIDAGILSAVASMVAVDEDGPKAGTDASFVEIPVMMPAGYGGGVMEKESMMPTGMVSVSYNAKSVLSVEDVQAAYPAPARLSRKMVFKSMEMRKEWTPQPKSRKHDSETMLYDLLALQLPGGGFGPEVEVLALLGADSLEALAGELGLAIAGDIADPASRRALLARAVLAVLAGRYAAQAAVWEPLVGASRKLAKV
jgi:hypothetical protein